MQSFSRMSPGPDKGCPLCGKPSRAEFRPFCSRGCKDRDLLNWLGEAYRVPARVDEEEDGSGLDSTHQA
jgi:endogenous inhibitor of DNA gyrase (YacG/DUF329 family)